MTTTDGPTSGPEAQTERATPSPRGPARGADWVGAATFLYAVAVLGILVLVRWVGDAWWGVTLLLFAPRWLLLAPLAMLAPASALVRRPSQWLAQGAVAVVVLVPLMGLSLPVSTLWAPRVEGETFRLFNYNRGGEGIDGPALVSFLERERIDLICFQEGAPGDPALEAFLGRGWYRDEARAIASRFPILDDRGPFPDRSTTELRYSAHVSRVRLRLPSGREIFLASVHLPTIRPGLERFLEGDREGLRIHVAWWRSELARVMGAIEGGPDVPKLIAGDFNMPDDETALAALSDEGRFRFAFEEAGWGFGYTRPTRSPWFRIDHILTSPEWVVRRCEVGPDFGSDHLPLVAEVVLPARPQ